eukprot:15079777-Alexandrium_andersonii.AAC.1
MQRRTDRGHAEGRGALGTTHSHCITPQLFGLHIHPKMKPRDHRLNGLDLNPGLPPLSEAEAADW